MPKSLWYLKWLLWQGLFRRLGRSLQTMKGVLFILLMMVFLVPWIFTMMFAPPMDPAYLNGVRRYGPLALLVFTLLGAVASPGGQALHFTPAETNLLFSG